MLSKLFLSYLHLIYFVLSSLLEQVKKITIYSPQWGFSIKAQSTQLRKLIIRAWIAQNEVRYDNLFTTLCEQISLNIENNYNFFFILNRDPIVHNSEKVCHIADKDIKVVRSHPQ